jgi:plasmid stabilization system protein ParE
LSPPLRYRVIVTPEAESDLRNATSYIRGDNPRAAIAWLKAARQRIKTLAHSPERCPRAPESTSFDEPIRELFYGLGNRGTYRILFVVFGKSVFVLHIRHGAMRQLNPDDR